MLHRVALVRIETTLHNISEYGILHSYRRGNLKSYMLGNAYILFAIHLFYCIYFIYRRIRNNFASIQYKKQNLNAEIFVL
jgi:hypothetical protein